MEFDVFLKIRLGLWVFLGGDHRGKVPFHLIILKIITVDVDLGPLAEVMLVRFLQVKLLSSQPPSILYSLRKEVSCTTHT